MSHHKSLAVRGFVDSPMSDFDRRLRVAVHCPSSTTNPIPDDYATRWAIKDMGGTVEPGTERQVDASEVSVTSVLLITKTPDPPP